MRSLVGLALISLALPAAAQAKQPCLPGGGGPTCHVWTGKVISVGDGDTIDVNVAGDGSRGFKRVRITGIQAMELYRYSHTPSLRRGACHAREATRRLERLVLRKRVKLLAQDRRSSTGHRNRPRRSVLVKRGGHWVDPAAILLREGHALWLPNPVEYAWNRSYSVLTRQAAATGRNLFDRDYCKPGPGPVTAPFLQVRWDAAGVDGQNINGEWGRIYNLGTRPLRLRGWRFRDSHLRSYRFPRGAVVRPRARVTVHIGRGHSGGDNFFWGLNEPVFENATFGARWMGDGGYLFDRHGDLRAWAIYPGR